MSVDKKSCLSLCETGTCKLESSECIPTEIENCKECTENGAKCTKCDENYYLEIEAICAEVCSIGTCGQPNFECVRASITDC